MYKKKNTATNGTAIQSLFRPRNLSQAATRQAAMDLEHRSKAASIQYRAAWGASIRARLNFSLRTKLIVQSLFLLTFYAVIVTSSRWVHLRLSDALVAFYMFVTWLICCVGTVLLPDDRLCLDRLAVIIPGRNPLDIKPKILWSNVEEVSLVDLAKPEERSKFALRLTEVSGEEHNIVLSLLEREALPTIASYLQEFAPHARGLAQLKEMERFYDYQNGKLEQVSYTQLWESSFATQFGLTSFTPLPPDARVQGAFTVIKQIAAGGFSAIYLIEDDERNKFVLKESVLPQNLDEDCRTKATEQFQREATILAKLNHPQIAKVFDHFMENGRNYLRMEFIDGPNLRKYVIDNHAQPEGVTVKWTNEMAILLVYLHDLSPPVVHRDFSPDNIVVRKDGKLVLIDFGAANEFIGAATGTLVGKHAYMAPEQIRGNAVPASDVYSLGACTFFCLTGRDPEPISTSSPMRDGAKVSDWFDQFVRRCTQLDTAERFHSAHDCLSYLQNSNDKNIA